MGDGKKVLVFNPDYYSADTYEEDEDKKSIFLKVFIQLSVLVVIFISLFFFYKVLIKSHLISLDFFTSNIINEKKVHSKVSIPQNEIIIREEVVEEKIKRVVNVDIPKIIEKKKVKIELIKHDNVNLTDEYINLVKKSLGNN